MSEHRSKHCKQVQTRCRLQGYKARLAVLQEGELRPQLLDRFGTSVNVTTLLDVDQRTQMVLDKMAYEQVCPGPCAARAIQQCCCTANAAAAGAV